jgi:two-component system invasion response regulator UvrY
MGIIYTNLAIFVQMKAAKISIVDEQSLVRSGLSALINSWNGMRVVHEFESGEDFLKSIQEEKHSDVVILANDLKGITGEETFLHMKKLGIMLPVILLTSAKDSTMFSRLRRKGLFSAELKTIKPELLKQRIVQASEKVSLPYKPLDSLIEKISPREMEFMRLICNDREYTYHEISEIMAVHVRTVDGFRKSLFNKLSVKSKTGLVMFAIKNKLV